MHRDLIEQRKRRPRGIPQILGRNPSLQSRWQGRSIDEKPRLLNLEPVFPTALLFLQQAKARRNRWVRRKLSKPEDLIVPSNIPDRFRPKLSQLLKVREEIDRLVLSSVLIGLKSHDSLGYFKYFDWSMRSCDLVPPHENDCWTLGDYRHVGQAPRCQSGHGRIASDLTGSICLTLTASGPESSGSPRSPARSPASSHSDPRSPSAPGTTPTAGPPIPPPAPHSAAAPAPAP